MQCPACERENATDTVECTACGQLLVKRRTPPATLASRFVLLGIIALAALVIFVAYEAPYLVDAGPGPVGPPATAIP